MGVVRQEDIVAYRVDPANRQGEELICSDCAKDEESENLKEDAIVTRDEVENSDDLYFCDRCKKRIG